MVSPLLNQPHVKGKFCILLKKRSHILSAGLVLAGVRSVLALWVNITEEGIIFTSIYRSTRLALSPTHVELPHLGGGGDAGWGRDPARRPCVVTREMAAMGIPGWASGPVRTRRRLH